jgi:hypothetical protein
VTPERHAGLADLVGAVAGDLTAYLRALVSWWCLAKGEALGAPARTLWSLASVTEAVASQIQADPVRARALDHTIPNRNRGFNPGSLLPTLVQVRQTIYLRPERSPPTLGYRMDVASAETQRVPVDMRIGHALLRYATSVQTYAPVRVGALLDIPELPDMPLWPGPEVADELAVCWARLNRWRERVPRVMDPS